MPLTPFRGIYSLEVDTTCSPDPACGIGHSASSHGFVVVKKPYNGAVTCSPSAVHNKSQSDTKCLLDGFDGQMCGDSNAETLFEGTVDPLSDFPGRRGQSSANDVFKTDERAKGVSVYVAESAECWMNDTIVASVKVPYNRSLHSSPRKVWMGGSCSIPTDAEYIFVLHEDMVFMSISDHATEQAVWESARRRGLRTERQGLPLSTALSISFDEIAIDGSISVIGTTMLREIIIHLCDGLYFRSRTLNRELPPPRLCPWEQELMAIRLHRRRLHPEMAITCRRSSRDGQWITARLVAVELVDLGPLPRYVQIEIRDSAQQESATIVLHGGIDDIRKFGWHFKFGGDDPAGTFYGEDIKPMERWLQESTVTVCPTINGSVSFDVGLDYCLWANIRDDGLYDRIWKYHSNTPTHPGHVWPLPSLLMAFRDSELDLSLYLPLSIMVHRLLQVELERLLEFRANDYSLNEEMQTKLSGYEFALVMLRKMIQDDKRTIHARPGVHPTLLSGTCPGILWQVKMCDGTSDFLLECYFLYRWDGQTMGFVVRASSMKKLNRYLAFEFTEHRRQCNTNAIHCGDIIPVPWEKRWEAEFNGDWQDLEYE